MPFTSLISMKVISAEVMWRYSEPNFTQIGQEMWKLWVEIHLCP
jgi:hypothetical protein